MTLIVVKHERFRKYKLHNGEVRGDVIRPTNASFNEDNTGKKPVSILYKSIAGRYRSVRVADGPLTARYRFIKNASWE